MHEMARAPPSMQACMEPSDWLKGIVTDQTNLLLPMVDNSSSSSPSADLLLLSPPPPALPDRRLRPSHEQSLKCPRCDSTHTKFCYYNNYSLSQPRYFCKTCRRYWTKGGSLRNVPVGGGCRKNKRPAPKKPVLIPDHHHQLIEPLQCVPTELQLSNFNFMFEGASHLSFMSNCIDNDMGLFAEEIKPGNRMLSLEWPEQSCGDYGLWTGMINGHGHGHCPSSTAM